MCVHFADDVRSGAMRQINISMDIEINLDKAKRLCYICFDDHQSKKKAR